jgi:preprotein translocase subunit SecA
VLGLGGLSVIGTERHESRRIDNQLRGRSGRQGDPGVSQFYVSLDDDLMRIFGGDRMKSMMERLRLPDDVSINNNLLSRAIEQAQSRVEAHNFDSRKQLVEYDDVMNKHRSAIYRRRQIILRINGATAAEALHQEIMLTMTDEQQVAYQEKSKAWSPELRLQVERAVSLRSIDVLWVEHLRNMEDLRESIGLRGYGQREPIVEYKQEAYHLFQDLEVAIDGQISELLLQAFVEVTPPAAPAPAPTLVMSGPADAGDGQAKIITTVSDGAQKIGRNDPCPCGAIDPKTGAVYKFKKCGLINAPHHRS